MMQRTRQLWQRETILATRQPAVTTTANPHARKEAETFMRDLAFVLKMTEKVKESMLEETCTA